MDSKEKRQKKHGFSGLSNKPTFNPNRDNKVYICSSFSLCRQGSSSTTTLTLTLLATLLPLDLAAPSMPKNKHVSSKSNKDKHIGHRSRTAKVKYLRSVLIPLNPKKANATIAQGGCNQTLHLFAS